LWQEDNIQEAREMQDGRLARPALTEVEEPALSKLRPVIAQNGNPRFLCHPSGLDLCAPA